MQNLTHLQALEAQSIHIMREVVAEFKNPAMLYSIGKDSSVMLHLLQKAFYPAVPPVPMLRNFLSPDDAESPQPVRSAAENTRTAPAAKIFFTVEIFMFLPPVYSSKYRRSKQRNSNILA